MSKETVDKLGYMGWEIDQGADPVKVCDIENGKHCVCYYNRKLLNLLIIPLAQW